MPRVGQTESDLRQHLQQQVGFLCRSAQAFDDGHEDEAKRLAAVLRVMLHDTSQSTSLLEQLDVKSTLLCYDTGAIINPRNLAPTDGLTIMRFTASGDADPEACYLAPLDQSIPERRPCLRPFSDWWSRDVIKDAKRHAFTRRDLVLRIANKDGGAHIDPKLDAAYAALTRDNSMGWTFGIEGQPPKDVPPPHLPSVRQVTHEVLSTLAWKMPVAFLDRAYIDHCCEVDLDSVPIVGIEVGRNDPCPCGSGRKYKKCHGAN